jgi:hypothetical protein
MKLMLIPALLLAVVPGPSVRFESDGIRVGEEVVSGKAISLKSAGQLPILVSGSTIENLSSANKVLEVAVADKTVMLEVGVRLDRQGESYRLSTHGMPFSVEGKSGSIAAEDAVSFKVTEAGFDFGKEGVLAGSTLTAKVVAKKEAVQDPPAPQMDFSKRGPRSQQSRADNLKVRVFRHYDPTVSEEAADSVSLRMRAQVTPTGLP